jgi:hypothetical protein
MEDILSIMSQIDEIPKSYEDAVRLLGQWGGEAGADDLRIFAAEDVGDEMVRLIHVTDQFPDSVRVSVYTFGASEEFPFRSALALASPDQWEVMRARGGYPGLPSEWKITNARQVWPPQDSAAGR